ADVIINDGWRFLRSDATSANAPTFNDASWTAVTLPHTWNATDGQDGGNNYYRGIGWYRRHYTPPVAAAGKRFYLQFDAANIVADVYVNGMTIGQHRGGFSRFRFDVTAALTVGADNVIAVKVSNARVADVAPLDADFTFFGGLYRDVHMLITDNVHIDTEDYGSSGVYLDTTAVTAASANLRARVRVKNGGTAAQAVAVDTVVVRADGTVQTRLSATATIPPGAIQELSATATIANPHLWDGAADPYLYGAYVELRVASQVTDWLKTSLGFRFFAIDAAQGFSLNGRYLDLVGVNRHQDRLGMGWAITTREHDEDMALIREMGANIVRLSHYQQAEYFHELADKAGMVLWAEIPLVNSITDSVAFTSNSRQQLTELIRQNYNHPSVLFWGIGNEQRTDTAPTNTLLTALNTLAKTEDASRLSTYAQCCTSDTGGLPAHTDIVGYNTYYGWYTAFGTYDQFGAWADNLHALRPTWKLGISEYGAGGALTQHAEPPVAPDPYGLFHPEEWQNLVHEAHWRQLKTRRYLWSKLIWNMFDFAVDSRNEGETPGRNDKGMVSYDRRTRKDAFFWYKANWSATPVVYISSRRFTTRPTATVPVKVYSNLTSVQLKVNGVIIGSLTSADRVFRWPSVALAVGSNLIEVTGTTGATTVTDSVTWTRP
ncbi:MAG: beta galactosidase jelly roll domain-containing protein, partial [Deltaproteobacteria bacterium]|nr:beta galactosidase jelly roll domain-containing protein [Deltaproteobacteria bacterium]